MVPMYSTCDAIEHTFGDGGALVILPLELPFVEVQHTASNQNKQPKHETDGSAWRLRQ